MRNLLCKIFLIRTENVKIILTLIASKGWAFAVLDIKTAFLNAPLKKLVYMHPPTGFPFDRGRIVGPSTKKVCVVWVKRVACCLVRSLGQDPQNYGISTM
jgi:hypothetical protein